MFKLWSNENATAQAWGITVLRVIVGLIFAVHGGQKLFIYGLAGTTGFFQQVGIPAAGLAAAVVIAVEFLGGLALILGLGTRWVTIPLAIDMLVALLVVHLSKGFFLPDGYEFVLVLLAANVSLLLLGSGAFALDNVFMGSNRAAQFQGANSRTA